MWLWGLISGKKETTLRGSFRSQHIPVRYRTLQCLSGFYSTTRATGKRYTPVYCAREEQIERRKVTKTCTDKNYAAIWRYLELWLKQNWLKSFCHKYFAVTQYIWNILDHVEKHVRENRQTPAKKVSILFEQNCIFIIFYLLSLHQSDITIRADVVLRLWTIPLV